MIILIRLLGLWLDMWCIIDSGEHNSNEIAVRLFYGRQFLFLFLFLHLQTCNFDSVHLKNDVLCRATG